MDVCNQVADERDLLVAAMSHGKGATKLLPHKCCTITSMIQLRSIFNKILILIISNVKILI
jgi:hypothetical protein